MQQYLSRYMYQKQFKLLKVMRSKQGLQINVTYLSRLHEQLCLRVFNRSIFPGDTNRFHNLPLLFGIKKLFKQGNFLDLRLAQMKLKGSNGTSV